MNFLPSLQKPETRNWKQRRGRGRPRHTGHLVSTPGTVIMMYMWPVTSLKWDDRWLPKSIICLRDYSFDKFLKDIVAGITVGLVALPLAMAFAIASGLTPQAGIYCAVVTGFLDLRVRRVENSDWRTDWRVRGVGPHVRSARNPLAPHGWPLPAARSPY